MDQLFDACRIRRMMVLVSLMLASSFGGCSWLPSQGPTAAAIGDQAATADGKQRFDIVEVDDKVIRTLLIQPTPSFEMLFGKDGKPPDPTIAVGDTVVVAIWEGGDETLFGSGLVVDQTNGAANGSRGTTLPAQVVPPDGKITIPFVGRVLVTGHTPAQAQTLIQTSLTGKTASPQVIVTVPQTAHNAVTIAGEVVHGSRVPLPPNGARLLDIIATAGGAQAPVYDVYVRLSRNGATTTIPFQSLVDKPAENLYAWPGDVLTLIRVPHTFAAFGATGRNAQITFDQEKLDLAQALAKSSGLLDQTADPAGVFLIRAEPLSLVRQIDPAGAAQWQEPTVPVIYHFNMQDAKTYFFAQNFPIHNNDIVYVAPAKANTIQKFFGLFGSISTPLVTGAAVNASVP
jgi:polysaccharide biosynthesis/export protein